MENLKSGRPSTEESKSKKPGQFGEARKTGYLKPAKDVSPDRNENTKKWRRNEDMKNMRNGSKRKQIKRNEKNKKKPEKNEENETNQKQNESKKTRQNNQRIKNTKQNEKNSKRRQEENELTKTKTPKWENKVIPSNIKKTFSTYDPSNGSCTRIPITSVALHCCSPSLLGLMQQLAWLRQISLLLSTH